MNFSVLGTEVLCPLKEKKTNASEALQTPDNINSTGAECLHVPKPTKVNGGFHQFIFNLHKYRLLCRL